MGLVMADIKAGYKQTDIGVIPEDWDVKLLGEASRISMGQSPLSKFYNTRGVGLPLVQGNADIKNRKTIIRQYSSQTTKLGKKGEVILTVRAPVGAVAKATFNCCLGRGVCSISYPNGYLFYYLQNLEGGWSGYTAGSTFDSINSDHVKRILIPIPKPEEQKAIAAALADVDGLIESIELLIAKKRDMKTAAMQQLLTGKKRLPGFGSITGYQQTDVGLIPKDWELVQLGNVADIDNDNLSSSTPSSYEIKYISLEDVKEGSLLGFSTLYFMSAPSRARRKLKYGDVLLGTVRPNLKSHLLFRQEGENFVCSTGFVAIRSYPHKANNEYIYAHLFGDVINHQIDKVLAGSNYPAISNSDVKNLFIPLPKTEEQTAIALALSDMDTEIEALEKRLEKARSLKTGMMQELLTGKTRFIKPVQQSSQENSKHNQHFEDAVIIAVLADTFGSEKFPLGRKRYTKLSYLLHRYQAQNIDAYLKKAAGPYNPKTKYGGAEKIALNKQYILEHQNGNFRGFITADKIDQAREYFLKWFSDDALQWVEQFRYNNNDELELLATIDMAVQDLRKQNKEITVDQVKDILESNREWKGKLSREIFSDANIQSAINKSLFLFGHS